MRRAGPVNLADLVCRDLGTSVKHTKNQLNVAVPFNNIEHRDANMVHKITKYLALKGGTSLHDQRDR